MTDFFLTSTRMAFERAVSAKGAPRSNLDRRVRKVLARGAGVNRHPRRKHQPKLYGGAA